MAFGIIIIGDEILSGRRSDKHLAKMIELLGERGLSLEWAEYIGDDPQRITATLRRTLATDDIVFCCGGIGATPDDHTRQCAADAIGAPLQLHAEAKALIQQRIVEMAEKDPVKADLNSAENQHRLKMGEFARGA
jgi:molybdopterin-biosynthesis enzyme MoeA-like protein